MTRGPPVMIQDEDPSDIASFLKPLRVCDSTLYGLACSFSKVFRKLASTCDDGGLFCPVPVTCLPGGQESGRYLAVDVGITTLRVAFIELLGETSNGDRSVAGKEAKSHTVIRRAQLPRVRRVLEKAWRIEEHLKKDQAHELFSWIGNCIAEVVKDDLTSSSSTQDFPPYIETGIAFSLPIKQDSLEEATLMPTGKGFTIGTDLDLRKSLLEGYERHTRRTDDMQQSAKRQRLYVLPRLKIIALTNDTVATLLSLAYSIKSLPNSRVTMGIVVGTGCNATIPMTLSDLHPSKARRILSHEPNAAQALVSTEWTLHGAASPLHDHGIITEWDRKLDARSARPGFQPLEYMTGGRYIGELIRIICHDYFTKILHVPEDALPESLVQEYGLTTAFVTDVVSAPYSDEILAAHLGRGLPPPAPSKWSWSPRAAGVLRAVAHAVQTRSAALIAAATVGLLACNHEVSLKEPRSSSSNSSVRENNTFASTSNWQGGPEELVVAYIGGIIQYYPNFKENCQRCIDRLVIMGGPQDGGKSILLREANDGVIIGAGVLAGMVAHKHKGK
ncbi:hypothetical protein VTN77DRAFT_5707 [Rasamsonia byssochlamydoides]|uniref:uncharacterized protein n=1 Tax=Rasamsonia byssochlamydoides TaxID=89139 RepID=UPI003741ED81